MRRQPAGPMQPGHAIGSLLLQREEFDAPAITEQQVLAGRPACQRDLPRGRPAGAQMPEARAHLRVELEKDGAVAQGCHRPDLFVCRAREWSGWHEGSP